MKYRYALKTAFAATFTSSLFMYFHYKNPQWAVMSTLLTMQSCQDSQCFESTLIAGFNRALGAVIGILIGILGFWSMNAIASDGFLWLILFVVFFSLWLAVIINQRFKSLQLIPACTIMVITMSLINSANVIAYDRAFEVLSGVLIALSFNFIFCPYKQNKQLEKIFFDVIRKSHNYFCHSINNFTNIEQDEDKVTKKALNKLLLDIENVKNSKITLFSDQDMLSQQQAIHSTAEKLVANMYQLRKLSTEIVNINIPAEHEVIISSLCHDLDRKLRRILKNRKIWTSKSHSALHEALYNSSNSKLDIKIIMLLNCLDELYDIILKVNTICSPKKRKKKKSFF